MGAPCGSTVGNPERTVDTILEILRNDVLEFLGLVVHLVPGHTQGLGQVLLDQSMVSNDLHRGHLPHGGQPHALVGLVGDERNSANFFTIAVTEGAAMPMRTAIDDVDARSSCSRISKIALR